MKAPFRTDTKAEIIVVNNRPIINTVKYKLVGNPDTLYPSAIASGPHFVRSYSSLTPPDYLLNVNPHTPDRDSARNQVRPPARWKRIAFAHRKKIRNTRREDEGELS